MKIAFIGTGNMGGALVRGVCSETDGGKVAVYDINGAATAQLSMETGCKVCGSMTEAAEAADIVVYCVKPQILATTLAETAGAFRGTGDKTIVSIAAGVKLDTIGTVLDSCGVSTGVVRIMPNLPVTVGRGALLVTAGSTVKTETLEELCDILRPCGDIINVDEHSLDLGMAISGCAPAFTAMFIEALADGGVEIGLPRDLAMWLAIRTAGGTSEMLAASGMHPGALKDAVCSPGGTTIAGVSALESGAFRATVASAVRAAYERIAT